MLAEQMSSFLGTYNISLDDKGRFNVPAKFRGTLEQSGPQLVVCAMEPFLVVFPHKEWAENEDKLSSLNADLESTEVNFTFPNYDNPNLEFDASSICRWEHDFEIYEIEDSEDYFKDFR